MAKVKRIDEAESLYHNALAALSSNSIHNWPVDCRREKAMTLSNQGIFRQAVGRNDSEEPLRSSIKIAEELASSKTAARKDRQHLAMARSKLGETLRDSGRNSEANVEFDKSLAGLETLVAHDATALEDRFHLGYIYEQQGKLLLKMNKLSQAKLAIEKAVGREREAVKLTEGKSPAHRAALSGHLKWLADVCLCARRL